MILVRQGLWLWACWRPGRRAGFAVYGPFCGPGWQAVDKDGERGLSRRRSGRDGQVPQPGQDLGKQPVAGREPQDQVAGVTYQPSGDGDLTRIRE